MFVVYKHCAANALKTVTYYCFVLITTDYYNIMSQYYRLGIHVCNRCIWSSEKAVVCCCLWYICNNLQITHSAVVVYYSIWCNYVIDYVNNIGSIVAKLHIVMYNITNIVLQMHALKTVT